MFRNLTLGSGYLRVIIALLICACAAPASASLGGDTASIQADQIHMQGTRRTSTLPAYVVHEIQAATGVVVREYVSSAGFVFAVTWHGPWPPDMRQILGSYFDQYLEGANAQGAFRAGHGPVLVEQPGLVVHLGGHPRSFVGRAYIPSMLPEGVRVEDIQ